MNNTSLGRIETNVTPRNKGRVFPPPAAIVLDIGVPPSHLGAAMGLCQPRSSTVNASSCESSRLRMRSCPPFLSLPHYWRRRCIWPGPRRSLPLHACAGVQLRRKTGETDMTRIHHGCGGSQAKRRNTRRVEADTARTENCKSGGLQDLHGFTCESTPSATNLPKRNRRNCSDFRSIAFALTRRNRQRPSR